MGILTEKSFCATGTAQEIFIPNCKFLRNSKRMIKTVGSSYDAAFTIDNIWDCTNILKNKM